MDVDVPMHSLNVNASFTTLNEMELDASCNMDYQSALGSYRHGDDTERWGNCWQSVSWWIWQIECDIVIYILLSSGQQGANHDINFEFLKQFQPLTCRVVCAYMLMFVFCFDKCQGSLTSTLLIRFLLDHLRFDDVYDCVNEMFVFLVDHQQLGHTPSAVSATRVPWTGVWTSATLPQWGELTMCVKIANTLT